MAQQEQISSADQLQVVSESQSEQSGQIPKRWMRQGTSTPPRAGWICTRNQKPKPTKQWHAKLPATPSDFSQPAGPGSEQLFPLAWFPPSSFNTLRNCMDP